MQDERFKKKLAYPYENYQLIESFDGVLNLK